MNEKQKRFVGEYLIDLNATAAAQRAGYGGSGKKAKAAAERTAARLMQDPEIQVAIKEAMAERAKRTEVNADNVIRELSLIAYANVEDYLDVGEDGAPRPNFALTTRDQFAAIVEVTTSAHTDKKTNAEVTTTRFKMADKKGALADLCRHLGLFKDSLNLNASQDLVDIFKEIDGKSTGLPNSPNGRSSAQSAANGAVGGPSLAS